MTFDPDLSKISMRPPRHTYIPKIMPIGPSAAAGEVATHGRKARKYIRIFKTVKTIAPIEAAWMDLKFQLK